MPRHIDLTPSLGKVISKVAGRSESQRTSPSGSVFYRNGDGTDTAFGEITGGRAIVPFIGDRTPPPVPSVPTCDGSAGVLVVGWDGGWANSVEATPPDFAGIIIEVQGGEHAVFTEVDRTLTAAGSVPIALTPGDYKVRLRSFDNAHNESLQPAPNISEPSAVVAVTVEAVDAAAIQEAIDAGVAAQQKADAAKSAADAASKQAGDAADAAAAAAGVAAGKGKVIIQSAQPDAADRLAQNLWIDTTSGANTPKRWSGSAWVAVTDKTATDAATAAANAKDAAAAAAGAAATAQQTATEAATTATAASAAANGAVTWSTASPSGTPANKNTVWFRYTSTGTIVGQWRWNAGTSAWVTQQLDNAVIANLDAGKIVTGLLDAARIAAQSITVDKLQVDTTMLTKFLFVGFPDSKGRTMMNGDRIRMYNSAGAVTIDLDATTGTATLVNANITGTLRTGTSGNRVEVSTGSFSDPWSDGNTTVNGGYVKFFGGTSGEQPGMITATTSKYSASGQSGYSSHAVTLAGGAPSESVFSGLYTQPLLSLGTDAAPTDSVGYSSALLQGDNVQLTSYGQRSDSKVSINSPTGLFLLTGNMPYRKITKNGDYVQAGSGWVPAAGITVVKFRRSDGNLDINNGATGMKFTSVVAPTGATASIGSQGAYLTGLPAGTYLLTAQAKFGVNPGWLLLGVSVSSPANSLAAETQNAASGYNALNGALVTAVTPQSQISINVLHNANGGSMREDGQLALVRIG